MTHGTDRSPQKITSVALTLCLLSIGAFCWAATQWQTDSGQSTIKFAGQQAGAEFIGIFKQFKADVKFDATDLATSRFDVDVDLKSVDTKDKERDDILRGNDLFAVAKWPTARFVAESFTAQSGDQFMGVGQLTIRDVTRAVPIEFTFQKDANGDWLRGMAKLKRLDFGVGQGEWKDTQWVANDVRVEFSLRLQR